MGALFSFLGGSAFRMIWGELSSYFTRKQEQAMEIERMEVQGKLDAAQHARNMEAIKIQADLGVKTIQVQAEADLSRIDASAWAQAVADVGKQTGVKLIDAWNASIRPLVATWAIIIITIQELGIITLSVLAADVACAALGIFLADRTLGKRGK